MAEPSADPEAGAPPAPALGWGIIGLGTIAWTTIGPAMRDDPACRLVAAVSRDQGRADKFAIRYGAPLATTSYDELLAHPEVDAVFVATPNGLHTEHVLAAAAAGKHVLCDKPLATTVEDARQQVEACAAAGVQLGVGFHNRYLPWVLDVRDLIAKGTIGDVLTVSVEASAGRRPPEDWRDDAELAGLGTVYNQGVHAYDHLSFILDAQPVAVSAMFDDEGGRFALETTALTLIRYDSGALATFNVNSSTPHPRNDIVIHGTAGRIFGRNLTRSREDGELRVLTEDGEKVTPYPSPGAHRLLVNGFTRAILEGRPVTPDGQDGLRSMILCDAMARSARSGRTVALDA